jgi:hypothetical protein
MSREKVKHKQAVSQRQEEELQQKDKALSQALMEVRRREKGRNGSWEREEGGISYPSLNAANSADPATRMHSSYFWQQLEASTISHTRSLPLPPPSSPTQVQALTLSMEALRAEKGGLSAENAELKGKVEESKQQLRSNEQMIRWLNQQVCLCVVCVWGVADKLVGAKEQ